METAKIKAVLDAYGAATSEHTKAVLEQEVWMLLSKEEQEERRREVWVRRALNAPNAKVVDRWTLLGEGDACEALWDRIEKAQMPLRTACERLKEARDLMAASDGKLSLKSAVAQRLQEYDTWPVWRTRDGQPYRRKAAVAKQAKATAPPVEVVDGSDRQFWLAIRESVLGFATSNLNKGVDPLISNKLRQEFESDLKVLCLEYSAKFYRARVAVTKEQAAKVRVKPAKLLSACSALSMDPPKHGKPVDLNHAKTQKKKLVRLYHPDVAGSNEGTRSMYEAVINAYETLTEYNQQLTETETT
jgi:hypothetical protein